MYVKIDGRIQELWLDTSFGPKWPKYSFQAPDPKLTNIFEISWFHWKQLMILDKIRSCMWKLMVGFRSYGLIRLLGSSGQNVVSRPRSQSQGIFWDIMILMDSFYDSGKKGVLFVKIGAMVLDLQHDMCFDKGFRPKLP